MEKIKTLFAKRTCLVCNKNISYYRSNAKFCSNKCRQSFFRSNIKTDFEINPDIKIFKENLIESLKTAFQFLTVADVFKHHNVDNSTPLLDFINQIKDIKKMLDLTEDYFLELLDQNKEVEKLCNLLNIIPYSDLDDDDDETFFIV
jgi:predicted RNA-binding protein with EMAP domain